MPLTEVVFNGQVIARGKDTVLVDGYRYFAPAAVCGQYLHRTRSKLLCPWKGVASYFTVEVDGVADHNAAWTYRHPTPLARAIKNRVAFRHGVRTVEVAFGENSA